MKHISILSLVLGVILFSNFRFQSPSDNPKSLKDAFKKDFLIGTALNNSQIDEKNEVVNDLIKKQFNAATPENIMKSALIHPKWDTYDFTMADKLVEYGKKNNIKINYNTISFFVNIYDIWYSYIEWDWR